MYIDAEGRKYKSYEEYVNCSCQQTTLLNEKAVSIRRITLK